MDKPGIDESTVMAITGKIMAIAVIILFLVVVFVLFLHLYAKWFWWRVEEPTPPSSSRRRRRFVFAPGQETAHPLCATKGLDSAILASLPVLMFTQEEFKEGLECAVCLCEVVEGEKARLLPKCNHGFHVECIDMWFKSHSTCPLCRNSVVAIEGENSSSAMSGDDGHIQSPNDGLGSGYSTDSPSFPTNVLFWGDHQGQVSSGGANLEEGSSASASASSSASSSMASGSGRQEGMLVIDVPISVNENFPEEESKSPMPTRLRSLKRLLSREKKMVPSSSGTSGSVDV
ncbi:23 kDa jasmonate-induced protein-like [Hibiscus syriacus]|uniref:RING-type E3 ubiquitin transferase n=1 Tax=Hibiscus syriacus TaxID=106335 RepID=A0A6A2WFB0_HIBSY|nr:RING-H2 finger protein ATL3-like [Hibiscus syriacus]KAE8656211.1 23 kDa jasmonate-induced protein-like [Hibiscus syriacus]